MRRPRAAVTGFWAQHTCSHTNTHADTGTHTPALCRDKGKVTCPWQGTSPVRHCNFSEQHTVLSPCFEELFYHLLPSPSPHPYPHFGAASSSFSLLLSGSSHGHSRLQSSRSFAPQHSPSGEQVSKQQGKQETQERRTTQGVDC